MSDYVAFVFEADVLDRAALEAVMEDWVAATRNEPRTTHYEWHLTADGKTLVTYERFKDSAAALVHLDGFGERAERFLAAARPTSYRVFGSPSAQLREAIADLDPNYMSAIGGFSRVG